MREAEELERPRLPGATRPPSLGSEPPELDQARLVGMQLQAEPRESLAQAGPKALRIVTMLKAQHAVVGETHDDHLAARVPPSPLLDPKVEDVVQVDVRKQGRDARPLRNALLRRPRPILDHSRAEPFLDQGQDPLVRDPMLKERHEPAMVKAREGLAEIRVEHPVHPPARDPDGERVQRLMRGAPRSEPI